MKTFGIFLAIVVVVGCATSPTGRKQIMLLSDSQMNQMGGQAFGQIKEQKPVETSPETNRYVTCVAMAIAKEASAEAHIAQWEVKVFKDSTANAFALPGGKIGVHTGILPVAKTQHQLAAVLGHEVGHVIARHGNERVSQGLATQVGLVAASLLTRDNPHRGTIMGLLGVGTQVGVILPFGRTQESEADAIGLNLMARAGFDPQEAVALWKNMGAAGGKQPPEFLSTHPSHATRIHDLEARMPEALQIYKQAQSQGKNPSCTL